MLRYILLAALVTFALAAAPNRPRSQATCVGSRYTWVGGSKPEWNLCLFADYEVACNTEPGRVTACDTVTSRCVEVKGERYFGSPLQGGKKLQQCVSQGALMFPDASVTMVAQVVFTSVLLLAGVVVLVQATAGVVPPLSIIAFVLIYLCVVVLTVSYYYLNGIVLFATVAGALGLFSARNPVLGAIGMMLVFSGLFWLTYADGLGEIQHHLRRNAGSATNDFFERLCNTYTRGFFSYQEYQRDDQFNPNILFWGYCSRNFLAGELFVLILAELLAIVFIAAGVQSLGNPEKKQ